MLPLSVDELSRPVGFVMQIRLQRNAPAGALNDLSSEKDSVPVRGDSEFKPKKNQTSQVEVLVDVGHHVVTDRLGGVVEHAVPFLLCSKGEVSNRET
jgi:hypothetical protein